MDLDMSAQTQLILLMNESTGWCGLNFSQHRLPQLLPHLLSQSWQPRWDVVQAYHPKKPQEIPKPLHGVGEGFLHIDTLTVRLVLRRSAGKMVAMMRSTCQRIWSRDGVDGALPLRDTPETWGRLINDIQITADERKWGSPHDSHDYVPEHPGERWSDGHDQRPAGSWKLENDFYAKWLPCHPKRSSLESSRNIEVWSPSIH